MISEKTKKVAIPLVVVTIYVIYFYVVTKFVILNNYLVRVDSISVSNIYMRLFNDFCGMLLLPIGLIIFYRKNLREFRLCFVKNYLQYVLIIIMVTLFFLHFDFTITGYYKFLFYLIVVAFGEEFIFRGYLYNKLKPYNKVSAVILSGLVWGSMHAILPGLMAGNGIIQIGVSMLSEIGGGILVGWYFIYIQEKSKSLYIPIFVHAILDYSVGGIGIITAIGTGVYLFIQERRYLNKTNQKYLEE